MLDPNKLSSQDLSKEEVVAALEQSVNQIVLWNDVKLALDFKKTLKKKLAELKEIPPVYEKILAKLNWIMFSLLPDQEIYSLFNKFLDVGLSLGLDLIYELKAKLVLLPYQQQEILKQNISRVLENSTLIFTKPGINFTGVLSKNPTIGNWVKDYVSNVVSKPFEQISLARSEYFSTNKNILLLDEETRKEIKRILELHDFVNTSSLLPDGYAEDYVIQWPDGEVSLMSDGNLQTVYVPARSTASKEETVTQAVILGGKGTQYQRLTQAYLGSEEEKMRIHQEESQLEKIVKDDLSSLRQVLLQAINQKDHYKTIAALRILATKGNLKEELWNDPKISDSFKNFLKENYKPEILADFQRNGFTAPYLSLFLQRVLKNQIGLSEADSARVGIQLENIMEKKGDLSAQGMVFGDLTKGEFVWHEVKDEGVRLSLPKEG